MKRSLCLAGALSLVLAALGGCATISRISSYSGGDGGALSEAKFDYDGTEYAIDLHPVEDSLLLTPSFGAAMGRSLATGATMGLVGDRAYGVYKGAAEAFLAPVGCRPAELYAIDDQFWEVRWTCPAGVDLRALILDQRPALRAKQPLRPAAPPT